MSLTRRIAVMSTFTLGLLGLLPAALAHASEPDAPTAGPCVQVTIYWNPPTVITVCV